MSSQAPPPTWLLQVAGDSALKRVRRATIERVAPHLEGAGIRLERAGNANAETQRLGTSRDEQDGTVSALGLLARVAAELAGVSGRLLSASHHYAGAALLRQVVEVEYLTWAFAHGERDAVCWLNSTREERMDFFTPKKLRDLSDGRFERDDYTYHCEQGGHPVPGASHLIGESSDVPAQILLVDLLLHSWRITDNLILCIQRLDAAHNDAQVVLHSSQRALAPWGEQDPYYAYLCSVSPDTPQN